ncbi:hypothetical protein [Paraburkholderia sp. RL18-085-BIA-A]|jgi:hypothetical protein
MCYGKPDEALALLLDSGWLEPNALGRMALDDFEHFCATPT